MKENRIHQRSFSSAIGIVNLYKYLVSEKREFVLNKQLTGSGTSVGANSKESTGGQYEKDFLSKLSMHNEAEEIFKTLAKIITTRKSKI